MSKAKSKKRNQRPIPEYLQEKIRRARDFLTPFQDENSSTKQSWFHGFIEWQTKVLFPNFQRNNELVESVRNGFWALNTGKCIDEKTWRRLTSEAQKLFSQLEEQHERLDRSREMFEKFRALCHDLDDNIDVLNSDLERLDGLIQGQLVTV